MFGLGQCGGIGGRALSVWTTSLALALALCLAFCATAQAAGAGIMAWGGNERGQVGNGTSSESVTTAVPVSGIANAVQVAGGSSTAIALLADGSVVAWGSNTYGQLGLPATKSESAVPVAVPGLSGVVAVDIGSKHSLALLANGTVMAWGNDDSGQLGAPSTGLETCSSESCRRTPAPVPGLANVIAISTSGWTNFALLADGTVMAWGLDSHGDTGTGVGLTTGCRCVDHPVPVPGLSAVVAVLGGAEGAAALLADGTVKTWGSNTRGESGNGTVSDINVGCACLPPTTVPGLSGVVQLGSGQDHHLVRLADGTVKAWGSNSGGQLGNGSTGGGTCSCNPVPTTVPGLASVRWIDGGSFHSLALLENGTVDSWGRSEFGALGDGALKQRSSPQPVPAVAGASQVVGHSSTSYALVGPSQTLSVAFAGAGSGKIGTNGLLCSSACGARFPQSQIEALRAEPGAGFAGWSGPCTGTGACQVRLDTDQTVTATFGPPTGTAITAAKIKSKKEKAAFFFTAPGAITGFQCRLTVSAKKKHHGKKKKHGKGKASASKKKGGKGKKGKGKKRQSPQFTACSSGQHFNRLSPATYKFEVRALDILGADAVPAVKKFTIKKAKKKGKHGQKKH